MATTQQLQAEDGEEQELDLCEVGFHGFSVTANAWMNYQVVVRIGPAANRYKASTARMSQQDQYSHFFPAGQCVTRSYLQPMSIEHGHRMHRHTA
ncbi:hypothetical protein DT603_04875 [Pseudoxanthomonas gei]|uniref:KTSC domain-containing protein n=1 Tax=Pseudoxanthomonas gei TaxID=1383030 RepID=A0ABX0A9I8_9GAMM|nr:hypothetical protein [Pseudoxanthomonas gei]